MLFGAITVTVFYLALIYAFEWTSVAVGTTLLYLAPAFVCIGAAVFLGEPLTWQKLAALALALVGCALVVEVYRTSNIAGSARGVAIGLIAATTYAAYSLMAKPLLGRYRPATVLAYNLAIGSAGLLGVKLVLTPLAWPDPSGLLAIALYSGGATILAPLALYTVGLRGLPAGEASILAAVEPVVAIGLAVSLLGESLAPWQAVGAGAILSGVVLLAVNPSAVDDPTEVGDEEPRVAHAIATATASRRAVSVQGVSCLE